MIAGLVAGGRRAPARSTLMRPQLALRLPATPGSGYCAAGRVTRCGLGAGPAAAPVTRRASPVECP